MSKRAEIPELEKMMKGGRKKFVRYEEGAMLYSMGLHSFQELAREANAVYPVLLPNFSAHVLRHIFCTRLCENETNLKVIQSVMGHADISTTMDIYADAIDEKKQEIMADLQGKIIL